MQGFRVPTLPEEVTSLEMCYRIADVKADAGDQMSAKAISFAAYTAQMHRRNVKRLAWACRETNARKRNSELQAVLMEMSNNDESIADLPSREYAQGS